MYSGVSVLNKRIYIALLAEFLCHAEHEAYSYGFVNIGTKICIFYLFLNYNISDAREIFIFGEKSRDFS